MKLPQKWALRLATVIVFLCSFLLLLVLEFFPWFQNLDRSTYDYLFQVRQPLTPAPDVVVVGIDEDSINQLGPWPWPRELHAKLLDRLREAGARLAVFDVVFDADTTYDPIFAKAIKDFGRVVLGRNISKTTNSGFTTESIIEPASIFLEAGAGTAFVDTPKDPDSVIRRYFCLRQDQTTLATEAILRATSEAFRQEKELVFMRGNVLPGGVILENFGSDRTFRINYTGPIGTIPKRSYYQVLDPTFPLKFLKDKVVFIGQDLLASNNAQGSETDRFPTPADRLLMPGVEIHANAYNTMRTHTFIRYAPLDLIWLLLVLFGILGTVYANLLKPTHGALTTLATVFLFAGAVYLLFVSSKFYLPSAQIVFFISFVYTGNTVIRYRMVLRERAQIQKAFKHYVSAEVLNELMKNPEDLQLGGKELIATVLFTDIAGFSKISEKITPRELTTMLNDYFERLGSIIMHQRGMVNKFIGDAVMAIWGAPLENPNHAVDAVNAALQIHRAMAEMDPIKCRIGINTGTMVAGNLGSRERFEYTVIGDSVNLASRLEGVNKPYHTDIMISEMTEELVRDQFLLREVDSIRVIGKQEPVRIYQVMDSINNTANPLYQRWAEMTQSFYEGLEAYRNQEWARAVTLFEKHFLIYPDDPVGEIYWKRCIAFLTAPPEPDWDGVYQMETK